MVEKGLILPTDAGFNIVAQFLINRVWIARILNIGSDEPLIIKRNKLRPVCILQSETNQVRVPNHLPFPLDDVDACLILLPDLLKKPFHPTETNVERIFT